jgi:O-antigen/teichoic acid export membrane protein
LPPVLGRLFSGTLWLTLKIPLQAIFAFWSVPLILHAVPELNGAYYFAWGFGFLQFLLEFGMSSALQRQVSDHWTRGDRQGVDRSIACGMTFYAAMAVVQVAALLGIAYLALPHTDYHGKAYSLIVKLLWLQAITAPCYGLSTVVSSVLQAARRYDFIPRFEVAVIILRFLVLVGGLAAGVDFFVIVVTQTVVQIGLSLGPALWVMVYELGYRPHFGGAQLADFFSLTQISLYVFLIQLSVVLADKIDTAILNFVLPNPGQVTTIYTNVSKPFFQLRQTGWMLSYLVMPAVASLVAARDERGLERVKYDGPRFLIGLLLPATILAWIYAGPFLILWVGPEYGAYAHLLRLFLVATLPLVIAVQVQMAIGMGKIKVIAIAALIGAVVNLGISYWLTLMLRDVSGVIWGTVLTTLISNLLIPGIYVFRVLKIRVATFLSRTLSAPLCGTLALIAATWALRTLITPEPRGSSALMRTGPLLAHLSIGCLAYLAGYLAAPEGRADLFALAQRFGRRQVSE